MKKIISLLLMIGCIISLVSCKDKYEPIASTKAEKQTVMTLRTNDNEYDVAYELYRAFFLSYKSLVDGGNSDVWSSEEKDKYIEEIDKMVIDRISEIYSAFELCDRIGFDIYSDDVEEKIEENIRISVEGGSYGNTYIEGFDSYEDYLESLKSMYLNYSVQALLFRYAIAIDAIDTYYIGTVSSDDISLEMTQGHIEYTRDDVKAFYYSDECIRVLRANVQKYGIIDPEAKAEELKGKMQAAADSETSAEQKQKAVFDTVVKSGRFSDSEVETGYVMGRYNLETAYYGDMVDAAFDLNDGEVSEYINVVSATDDSYYILYKMEKNDEHFELCYDGYTGIEYVYLTNYVGKMLHGIGDELKSSIEYTDALKNISHAEISM